MQTLPLVSSSGSSLRQAASGLATVLALSASFLASGEAQAFSLRVYGHAGYEKITPEVDEGKKEVDLKGYTVGALAGVGFFDSIPGFSLLAGGGLKHSSLKGEEGGIKTTLTPLMVAGEFGAEFSAIPLLRLQALVGYDLGLAGGWKLEGDAMDAAKKLDPDFKSEGDLETFNRMHITARALFTVAPAVSVGLEPSFYSGKMKMDGKGAETTDFDGFALKAVAAITL